MSATKATANKKMIDLLSQLLSATDLLPIRGEYKLWLYRNYVVSLLRFYLSVDAITKSAITKLENLATPGACLGFLGRGFLCKNEGV